MSKFQTLLLAVCLMLFCASETILATHPFHVSRAEIEYNARRKTFEVALCVWPVDLEKVTSTLSNEVRDLDQMDEKTRDRLFCQYVTQNFRFVPNASEKQESSAKKEGDVETASAKTQPAEIRWAGSELTLKQAWLYFEVDAKPDATEWTIENRIFFELHEDQMNLVQIKNRKQVKTLTLSVSEPSTTWTSVTKPEVAGEAK